MVLLDRFLAVFMRAMGRIGADSSDSDEIQLQKTLLMATISRFIGVSILWGVLYLLCGEVLAAAIVLIYAAVSLLSTLIFHHTHQYQRFRFSQLLLLLAMPTLLTITLGGVVNSSAVMLWGFLSPLGALVFSEPRAAFRWFAAFGALLVLCILLQPYLRASNNLPSPLIYILLAMNIFGVSGVVFTVIYFFVVQRQAMFDLLRTEQEKSERLLLNILPREIAAILKANSDIIADQFDQVSILFADVANFTPMSAALPPADVVKLLNEIFSYFDTLAEKYGIEKIKTIGDCYMVAAGVPSPRSDHAQAVAQMALDMCNYVNSHITAPNGAPVNFRVGINSGPVVAGVIGRKKFIYDLWGDSVNTASRMESHGTPGKIHISRDTYELIKNDYVCEPRGKIMIKGKGEMETWFLVGKTT